MSNYKQMIALLDAGEIIMRYLKCKDCDSDPMFYGITSTFYSQYNKRLEKLVSLRIGYEIVTKDQVTDEVFDGDEIIIILDDHKV